MACSSPAIFRSSFAGSSPSPTPSGRRKIVRARTRLIVAASASSSAEGNGGFAEASASSSASSGVSSSSSASPSPRLKLAEYEAMPAIGGAKRVVLVRHGQSTWNEEGRIQGSSDWAVLTRKGESQAETSKQMLMADSFDLCFHSPLARAKKTAEIIWASRKNPMVSVDDLREIDLYAFQGLMKNEGKQRYGDAFRKWQVDPPNFIIDGHYPVRELWVRAQKCWSKILTSPASSILIVAHNAVNQALVATAAGLGPNYFRQLLQSNCGVTVIDFTPSLGGDGPPYTCLDRLNQTPSPPVAPQSGGRKAKARIVFVCHGATESTVQNRFPAFSKETMTMLGVIQSRKTAELLLDVRAGTIFCSPQPCSVATAAAICEVQEAADCLGADCVPRYVEVKQLTELRDMNWGAWEGKTRQEVAERERWQDFLQHEDIDGGEKLALLWERAGVAWGKLRESLRDDDDEEAGEGKTIVVVADEMLLVAMLGHCLELSQASIGSFRLDTAGLSVIEFPDGYTGRGVVRCWNYTAHLGRWAVPVTRPALADEEF